MMKRIENPWNKDRVEQLRYYAQCGVSIQQAANIYGVPIKTLKKKAKMFGIVFHAGAGTVREGEENE